MGNFILSGAAVRKAGNNVDVAQPAAFWIESISGAEATLMAISRSTYGSFDIANAQDNILADTAARMVAMDAWNSKPTGSDATTSRIEFEDRINVLRDGVLRGISLIKDQKVVTFIGGN